MQRRKYALLKQPYELDSLADVSTSSPVSGDVLTWNGTAWVNSPVSNVTLEDVDDQVATLLVAGDHIALTYDDPGGTLTIDAAVPRQIGATWGSASALVAGDCADVVARVPKAGTITGAYVYTRGGTGSCVIDVWNDTYANYPPTVADSITASAKPTVSSGIKSANTTLTGWDKTLAEGDVLVFHVDSTSTFTGITVILTYE